MSLPNCLVSCIITTKDRPDVVIRAVKSVLQQSYRNIEIILVDDSDGGDTQKIIPQFAKQIKYIKNEKSRGACYSRNVGLSEARGDFIALLDDDDFWMPKKIERQLQLAMKYPLVGCNYVSYIGRKKYYMQQPEFVNYEDMLYYNFLGSCSFVLADTSAIKKCRFDESLEAGQDWDMWLSVMKENNVKQVVNISEYLAGYNHGPHHRISNTAKYTCAAFSLYKKRTNEYTPFTANMLSIYNLSKTDGSPVLCGFREMTKASLKHKSLFFVIKILFKRLFGRVEIF
jgi:glycosyltransferase involved in cell wall biosynthesis